APWQVKTKTELQHKNSNGTISTYNPNLANTQRTKRVSRNQLISSLNKEEAQKFGIGKKINSAAEDHHLAEMMVTQNDGSRYVYGLAAYNTYQTDVSFALATKDGSTNPNCGTGLVEYDPSNDPKPNNGKG